MLCLLDGRLLIGASLKSSEYFWPEPEPGSGSIGPEGYYSWPGRVLPPARKLP